MTLNDKLNRSQVMTLITELNISVKSWNECTTMNIFDRMQMMSSGTLAFTGLHEKDIIFIIDDSFNKSHLMTNYVLAHELGHILCRRREDDVIVQHLNELDKLADESLGFGERIALQIRWQTKMQQLRMEEEFLVDNFAKILVNNYFNTMFSIEEQQFFDHRMSSLELMIDSCMKTRLNGEAIKMVNSFIK